MDMSLIRVAGQVVGWLRSPLLIRVFVLDHHRISPLVAPSPRIFRMNVRAQFVSKASILLPNRHFLPSSLLTYCTCGSQTFAPLQALSGAGPISSDDFGCDGPGRPCKRPSGPHGNDERSLSQTHALCCGRNGLRMCRSRAELWGLLYGIWAIVGYVILLDKSPSPSTGMTVDLTVKA